MASVGAVFETKLRPRLEMIGSTNPKSAEKCRQAYGFARATDDWRSLVSDPKVEAIVIATPQAFHREIAEACFDLGKPVFCEKPMGANLVDALAMTEAAEASGQANMVGYNYVRTPATQFVRQLLEDGVIGELTWFRGEHTEDFLSDPDSPANWRTDGTANGCMGDLSPHMINGALALMGPIGSVMAEVETVHKERPGGVVTNDDQAQICLLYTSPSPRDRQKSRMPSSA